MITEQMVEDAFKNKGIETARCLARKSGSGTVVSHFIQLTKSSPKPASARTRQLPQLSTPHRRVGKTDRMGGADAAKRRKKAKAEADRQLREQMRGK